MAMRAQHAMRAPVHAVCTLSHPEEPCCLYLVRGSAAPHLCCGRATLRNTTSAQVGSPAPAARARARGCSWGPRQAAHQQPRHVAAQQRRRARRCGPAWRDAPPALLKRLQAGAARGARREGRAASGQQRAARAAAAGSRYAAAMHAPYLGCAAAAWWAPHRSPRLTGSDSDGLQHARRQRTDCWISRRPWVTTRKPAPRVLVTACACAQRNARGASQARSCGCVHAQRFRSSRCAARVQQ